MSGVADNEAIRRLNAEYGTGTYVTPSGHKMGLATGDPGTTDSPASEASGGGGRQVITFGTGAARTGGGGQVTNSASVTFTNMAAQTSTFGFITREDLGVVQEISFPLTAPVPTLAGQSIVFAAGSLTISHFGV